jgi:hypothetical protein
MIRSGLLSKRDRDRHALAHAARELVRVGQQPLVGRGDAHTLQRVARTRLAPGAADVLVRLHASIIWVSMRSTGLSVIIGSWKIIAMRLPRILRISSGARPNNSSAR